MSAKHTPGPWTQGTSEVGADCVWLNGATEPKGEMGPGHTWIDCGTRANARLIAAAPELLDALKQWAHAVAIGDEVELINASAARDATIVKATGEEK